MMPAPQGGSDIDSLVKQREQLRHQKQWQQADMVRDQLRQLGVTLDDKDKRWTSSDGKSGAIPTWNDIENGGGGGGSMPSMPSMMVQGGYAPVQSMMPSMMPEYPPMMGGMMPAPQGGSDIDSLVKQREQLRHQKQWQQADMVRDQLRQLGVTLDDKDKRWTGSDGKSGAIPTWD